MARGFTPYYVYDAWGRWVYYIQDADWSSVLGGINPLLYRGYLYDIEIGLYYLQSRYYDMNTHRFLNADVFTATGQGLLGNNMFAYCNNNPVRRIDITGTADADCFDEDGKLLSSDEIESRSGGGGVTSSIRAVLQGVSQSLSRTYSNTLSSQGNGTRYASYSEMKTNIGSAGENNQWHHVVEQCQQTRSGFQQIQFRTPLTL